jgi:predicted GTPase
MAPRAIRPPVASKVIALPELKALLSRVKWDERPPHLVFAGRTGVGKSSTINALVREPVADVGHDAPKTVRARAHPWTFEDRQFVLIDLPGLGESSQADARLKNAYQRAAAKADVAFVIVEPPRPLEAATIATVKCLLRSGVHPSKLVFGYNKVTDLRRTEDGRAVRVRIGPQGPSSDEDRVALAGAERAFRRGLRRHFPRTPFSRDAVVVYDCETTWNLERLLLAAVRVLPAETLTHFDRATRRNRRGRLQRATGHRRRELDQAEDDLADTMADRILDGAAAILMATKYRPVAVAVKLARPVIKPLLKMLIRTGKAWWGKVFG